MKKLLILSIGLLSCKSEYSDKAIITDKKVIIESYPMKITPYTRLTLYNEKIGIFHLNISNNQSDNLSIGDSIKGKIK